MKTTIYSNWKMVLCHLFILLLLLTASSWCFCAEPPEGDTTLVLVPMQNIRKALFLLDNKDAQILSLNQTIQAQSYGLVLKDSIIHYYHHKMVEMDGMISLKGLEAEVYRNELLLLQKKINRWKWVVVGVVVVVGALF